MVFIGAGERLWSDACPIRAGVVLIGPVTTGIRSAHPSGHRIDDRPSSACRCKMGIDGELPNGTETSGQHSLPPS